MDTIITALIVLGFIALIVVGLLVFVHKKDQKREAAKDVNTLSFFFL